VDHGITGCLLLKDFFSGGHKFLADCGDKGGPPGTEIFFKILLDTGGTTTLSCDLVVSSIRVFNQFYRFEESLVKSALNPGTPHIRNGVNLQILAVWVRDLHVRWMGRQDHVLQLYRMLWQRVDKVDMKLAKE